MSTKDDYIGNLLFNDHIGDGENHPRQELGRMIAWALHRYMEECFHNCSPMHVAAPLDQCLIWEIGKQLQDQWGRNPND